MISLWFQLFVIADNQDEIVATGLLHAVCGRLRDSANERAVAAGCEAVRALVYEHGVCVCWLL